MKEKLLDSRFTSIGIGSGDVVAVAAIRIAKEDANRVAFDVVREAFNRAVEDAFGAGKSKRTRAFAFSEPFAKTTVNEDERLVVRFLYELFQQTPDDANDEKPATEIQPEAVYEAETNE